MEDFSEDWSVLRRRGPDRVTTTMNVGEALTRLSSAVWTFFMLEEDDDRGFFFAIEQKRQKESHTKLEFRVTINGFKSKENAALFAEIGSSPFFEELEQAVEHTFREVRRILLKFNTERAAIIQKEHEELQGRKGVLMKLERNLTEMGLYDPSQAPLPFPDEQPS